MCDILQHAFLKLINGFSNFKSLIIKYNIPECGDPECIIKEASETQIISVPHRDCQKHRLISDGRGNMRIYDKRGNIESCGEMYCEQHGALPR